MSRITSDHGWCDAQRLQMLHPDTFEAPTAEQLGEIQINFHVKVCKVSDGQAERIWARITSIESTEDPYTRTFQGEVLDELLITDLHIGELVEFEGRHVYSYLTPEEAVASLPLLPAPTTAPAV